MVYLYLGSFLSIWFAFDLVINDNKRTLLVLYCSPEEQELYVKKNTDAKYFQPVLPTKNLTGRKAEHFRMPFWIYGPVLSHLAQQSATLFFTPYPHPQQTHHTHTTHIHTSLFLPQWCFRKTLIFNWNWPSSFRKVTVWKCRLMWHWNKDQRPPIILDTDSFPCSWVKSTSNKYDNQLDLAFPKFSTYTHIEN